MFLASRACLMAALVLVSPAAAAQQPSAEPATRPSAAEPRRPEPVPVTDLDRFMEKVLARRDVNRKALNDYVLDEAESFEVLGPGRAALYRTRRDYTWYVRDGMHVRSPVRFDGVAVGATARDEYEERWIRRERERRERKATREITATGAEIGPGGIPTEPRFVSEAYFMDFTFEPGNYLIAGRETLEGQEVLRVEYYPTRLFSDRDEDTREPRKENPDERRERGHEEDINRRMNKTALVTLWIDPAEHQIVKYTFDNVWLDFLPGAWLVRIDDLRASMTMGRPFPGVWLPHDIRIRGRMTLANGSYEVSLSRLFSDYREARVSTTIKAPSAPKVPHDPPPDARRNPSEPSGDSFRWNVSSEPPAGTVRREHGPSLPDEGEARQETVEIVREVRVHGNAFLSDEAVLSLAGVAIGSPVGPGDVANVEKRLKDSGWFESVEVRKRYRSLTDSTDVALVLVVHERPGVTATGPSGEPVVRPLGRLRSRLMFLPILSYADGYGFTYGARFSTVDVLGAGERLSVPLTWGGTKRAALEFDRTFERGPLTRVTSSVAIWNRENPRFEIDDQRVELQAGAERQLARVLRFGVDASRSRVEFGTLREGQWTIGATAALDTRGDPAFPRNAVYIGGGWTGLHVDGRSPVNRYRTDTRGYLRLVGQSVLAARAQYWTSDGPLPPYERLLLGGSSTLRGYRAGSFDADRMLVTSAEVRTPITSIVSGARLGVTVFADAAKAADDGARLHDAPWRQSAGAGVFVVASVVRINVDVARAFDGGSTRLHLSSGFAF